MPSGADSNTPGLDLLIASDAILALMKDSQEPGDQVGHVTTRQPGSIEPLPWLRPGGILLHIGARKTGSTALQAAFAARRAQLRELGLLYPGKGNSQNRACKRFWRKASIEPWNSLVSDVAQRSDRAIISSENLEKANPGGVAQIAADLGAENVQIVFTLRPLVSLIPSQWQNTVRFGAREPYRKWLERILRKAEAEDSQSWLRHDATVHRWMDAFGPDNTMVVALSPRSIDIAASFEAMIGLPDGFLPKVTKNRSLSADGSEFLRLRNIAVHKSGMDSSRFPWSPSELEVAVDQRNPSPAESRLVLPESAVARVQELQEVVSNRILASGVQIRGDLVEFVTTPPTGATESGSPVISDPSAGTQIANVGAELLAQLQWSIKENKALAKRQQPSSRFRSSQPIRPLRKLIRLVSGGRSSP